MFRYLETCSCNAHISWESPTDQSYVWNKYVLDWRENHQHVSGSDLFTKSSIVNADFGSHFTPENMEDRS